ncbi:MAG: RecX family transcriptional regulator [Lachnospiraceae bacterium]|nr:RecX family transcriptional regulator [Candidatus Merdinaster equi]
MIITEVEILTKSKYRIITDEEVTFVLYRGDLRKYKLAVDAEITPALCEELNALIAKRAKIRLLGLLKMRDMTCKQATDKLVKEGYERNIVDSAIDYAASYGYIGDAYYASKYYDTYKDTKSVARMKQDLLTKGIAKSVISEAFEKKREEYSCEADPEIEQICKLLRKRGYCDNEASYDVRMKTCAFLSRKGYSMDKIRRCMSLDITIYAE